MHCAGLVTSQIICVGLIAVRAVRLVSEVARWFHGWCDVLYNLWYGDGAGNTVEENSSIFSLIRMR